MSNTQARQIYEAVNNGDPISDQDLAYGIKYFTTLSDMLIKLGPIYYLAWCDAANIKRVLEQYNAARQRNSKRICYDHN